MRYWQDTHFASRFLRFGMALCIWLLHAGVGASEGKIMWRIKCTRIIVVLWVHITLFLDCGSFFHSKPLILQKYLTAIDPANPLTQPNNSKFSPLVIWRCEELKNIYKTFMFTMFHPGQVGPTMLTGQAASEDSRFPATLWYWQLCWSVTWHLLFMCSLGRTHLTSGLYYVLSIFAGFTPCNICFIWLLQRNYSQAF